MSELDAPQDQTALRELLLRSERAGATRRAVMLHTDRLPPGLSRPHHLRLAREALSGLARAERAQVFDLTLGRVAIVWRGSGSAEVAQARLALEHLLAGQPSGQSTSAGELLTLYDLPEQAPWLLDEIAQAEPTAARPASVQKLDAHQLARLEAGLAQADLSRFTRWRPVMHLDTASPELAWEERHFAVHEIAASLCPEVAVEADPWLFARLTRTLDRRMLALLTAPSGLRGCRRLAIHLNVETMVAQDFLRFDEALPLALRGEVILNVSAADLLADPERFAFATRFARARRYRLALSRATLRLMGLLDLQRLGLDYVHLAHTPESGLSGDVSRLVPAGTELVAHGLDSASRLEWATRSGFLLGCGSALAG